MRVFNKRIILIVFLVLIFFAGIIALTQENDEVLSDIDSEEIESLLDDFDPEMDDWSRPARWFRSNSAGMALEEVSSRFSALRNQYALAINYVSNEEIPDYLSSYYDKSYYVEVRILYKKGEQIKTQWIFRDKKLNTRVNAVLMEPEPEIEPEDKNSNNEQITLIITEEETEVVEAEDEEEPENIEEIVLVKDIKNRKGFIEIFDENYFLTSEYRFFEDGRQEKTEYELKDNLLVTAEYFVSVNNKNNFKSSYIDYYRYNRSLSLRNIERIFKDEISSAPVTVSFPRRIMDSVKAGIMLNERINLYPDFFGNVFVSEGYKMNFNIDDKGRILGQTLYDEEDKLIWTIQNTWKDNRIVSTVKTEGETILAAEYTYNRDGERISERNIKNGVLERVVLIEGDTEIEELYMNNTIVLRAVWEDGRKISETRIRN